jgi:hypothetical protein
MGSKDDNSDPWEAEGLWDIEGRKLCATWWGTGIGHNAWKDADVVFLFDEFFVPKRTIIATTQGLKGDKATEGALARMKGINSSVPAVDGLWEGHLLRWFKQMALRGKGRFYDEHGMCGTQKVVCSVDRTRLLANKDRLFPGAHIEIVAGNTDTNTKRPYADKVLDILSRPGLPNIVTTNWIGEEMGKAWRSVSKNVMKLEQFVRAFGALGWEYKNRKGKKGAYFERRAADANTALVAAV